MSDREADMVVADDAEAEGRHDVAELLRARHIGSDMAAVRRRVEEYRALLGLRTWDEQSRVAVELCGEHSKRSGIAVESGRRSGRTVRGLLDAIARCDLFGRETIVIEGSHGIRRHCMVVAMDLLRQLGMAHVKVKAISDRSPHLRFGQPGNRDSFVVYRDHAERSTAAPSPRTGM